VIHSFPASPVANALPTGGSAMAPAKPFTSLKLGEMIHHAPVVAVTTQTLAKPYKLHTHVDDHAVPNAQIREPAGMDPVAGGLLACPKPLARLVMSPSTAKDLPLPPIHTNSLQPTTTETRKP